MKAHLTESELLHKAAAYCSSSEHCKSEVQEKVIAWGGTQVEATRIVKRLISERFIDDERYAKAFVKDKFRFNQWGKYKIKMTLQQKKLNPETIENALAEIEEEDYQETLIEILHHKRKTIKDKDYQTVKGKLFRFAASRGFESNLILQTISRILQHEDSGDME
ncbi:MAG: regulatory protein RecX [Bacteroidales bacterium]|nr:regulatory protein RecX [Bacteroidales bacterium]